MIDCDIQNEMCDEVLEAELQAELEAHQEWGFYVPTREELMDTTGEFFLHMLTERE